MKKIVRENNKGVALVSVLVIITLLSLLAGTVLNMAYLAYSRKLVEKRNNENFYAAEAVLDTVRSVLQNSAAEAIPEASNSEEDFAKAAFSAITGTTLTSVTVGDKITEVSTIEEYLYEKIIRDGDNNLKYDSNYYTSTDSTMIAKAITPVDQEVTTYSGIYGNGGYFKIGYIECEEDGVRIGNVEIKYVNDEGYTASIKTDIVIRAPYYISVDDEPLGSYSMFAGSGVEIISAGSSQAKALNNVLYLHQEGNVYFGAMAGSNSEMSVVIGGTASSGTVYDSGQIGGSILSIDGTNVICNGDIRITNGGALVLTGGDGTEMAYVQVNGYIVLEEGASLFLAPNVKLYCKGIVTSISYSGDTVTVTDYTGTSNSDIKASQFYPLTDDYLESDASWATYLQKYYDGEIDVEQLFSDTGCLKSVSNDDYMDDKYLNLYEGGNGESQTRASNPQAGVYVLNETYDGSGWSDRDGCYYELLTCDVGGTSWKNAVTGASSSQIYCDPDDYNSSSKVSYTYGGTTYNVDPEFWDIVNVPLLLYAQDQQQQVQLTFSGYTCETSSSYSEYTWTKVKSDYTAYLYNVDFDTLVGVDSDYLSRTFYIPTNNTEDALVAVDYGDYDVETSLGTFTVDAACVSFRPNSNFQPGDYSIQFALYMTSSESDYMTIRIGTGSGSNTSTGIVLSNNKVSYSANTGVMRVISLLELASLVSDGSSQDIEEDGNPVHDLLEYIGSAYVNNTSSKQTPYELHLADNMFDGGMSVFWKMSNTSDIIASDDSDNDLVDYDDWNRN